MSNNLSFRDVFTKGAVVFNPVLVQLAGLCPVVAASTSLKNAAVLSAVAFAELIAVCVIASAVMKKLPRWVRMPLYLVIGLLLICPFLWYVEMKTLINLSLSMKIYIPLIAINSVVAVHCEQFAVKNSVRSAFYDAAAVGIGASAIFIAVGVLRELLGSASIGGMAVNIPVTFKGMLMPFG
jgi:electron transport complex protein RnfE